MELHVTKETIDWPHATSFFNRKCSKSNDFCFNSLKIDKKHFDLDRKWKFDSTQINGLINRPLKKETIKYLVRWVNGLELCRSHSRVICHRRNQNRSLIHWSTWWINRCVFHICRKRKFILKTKKETKEHEEQGVDVNLYACIWNERKRRKTIDYSQYILKQKSVSLMIKLLKYQKKKKKNLELEKNDLQ